MEHDSNLVRERWVMPIYSCASIAPVYTFCPIGWYCMMYSPWVRILTYFLCHQPSHDLTVLWKGASLEKFLVSSSCSFLIMKPKCSVFTATPCTSGGKARILAPALFRMSLRPPWPVIPRQISSIWYKEFLLMALASASSIIYKCGTPLFKVLKLYLLLTCKTVGFQEASSYILPFG